MSWLQKLCFKYTSLIILVSFPQRYIKEEHMIKNLLTKYLNIPQEFVLFEAKINHSCEKTSLPSTYVAHFCLDEGGKWHYLKIKHKVFYQTYRVFWENKI